MQSMLGTTHPLLSCVNKNYECTVVPKQNYYVHLNFTNLNGRSIIQMSYVEEKKIKNYVVSAYSKYFYLFIFWVQGKPYSYFCLFL